MEKKKVGIITFHTADNYGALYQSYALEKFISQHFDYNVEIINYCTERHIEAYKLLRKRSDNPLKNLYRNFLVIKRYLAFKNKKIKFQKFREQYLVLSAVRYATEESLLKTKLDYDICVTGSDQVFHPYIEDYRAYYMAFSSFNGRKVAYAPSFGIKDFTPEVAQKVKPLISDYYALSCREKDGAEFISALIRKDVPVVLDPVLLIDSKEWHKFPCDISTPSKYIFVYDLNGGAALVEIAKRIQARYGGQIICATSNSNLSVKNVTYLYDLGPLEMIGFINEATFVVTDSFHGTAMAVAMETKVISYVAHKIASSRAISLLSQLDIADQICQDINAFDITTVQFKSYRDKLERLRECSIRFLEDALN